MADIDFPPGASNGTTHSQNGKTWIYDGVSWSIVADLIPDATPSITGLVNTFTQSFGGNKNFNNDLSVTGGLGVTGQSIFRNNIEIRSGGLGVTGLVVAGSGLSVNNGVNVTGQSIFRNNIEIQSGGLGVTGLVVAGSGLSVNSGVTVTGSINSDGITIRSGGLGVTGQSVFKNNIAIHYGGIGVTGAAIFSAGTASPGGAPIYLNSGVNLSSPESGALEFDGTYLYFTPVNNRKQISHISISSNAPSGASAGDFWWDSANGSLKINYDSYWVDTSGVDVYSAITNQILSLGDTTNSTSSTTGSLVVKGGIGVSGNVSFGSGLGISGLTTLTYTSENLNTKTSATGTIIHDLSTGSIFYHSAISTNFTANITNVPTTSGRALGITIILAQGATAYMVNAIEIDGIAQTIKWVNNSLPSGAANKVDVVGFSLIRVDSSWTVLGQYSTYG